MHDVKPSHAGSRRCLTALGLALFLAGAIALDGPTAAAQPTKPIGPPTLPAFISGLQVRASGTEATITFKTSEPAHVAVAHKRAGTTTASPSQPPRPQLDGVVAPQPGGVGASADHGSSPATYKTDHAVTLKQLQSNTTYEVSVAATTRSGQRLTSQTSFHTLWKRVGVTVAAIIVDDDGDGFLSGAGDAQWELGVSWGGGSAFGCYPYAGNGLSNVDLCQQGSFNAGQFMPRNYRGEPLAFILVEENLAVFPSGLQVHVKVREDDFIPNPFNTSFQGEGYDSASWQVPQGVERASARIAVRSEDRVGGLKCRVIFALELFYDDKTYPPNTRSGVHSTW